ncbi:hypothetical protein ACFY8P_15985 [Streptomyces sp. NPDC012693]|uniref:hypothetical protein n=1 Tax=unclassified Streptomyces TaxID=2593676 RepID=UPI00202F8C8D|nr:hypothetical protein [Streptomyces sp. MSC1_001]
MGTMRTRNRLAKIVLAAALGGMALTACGTADPSGRTTAEAPAVEAGAPAKPTPTATPTAVRWIPPDALHTHPDPEVRALALTTRITNTCAPGSLPELPALPAVDDISAPAGPEQPTESPRPVPLPPDVPEPPSSGPGGTRPAGKVPVDPVDECVGDAHAERIRKALDGVVVADYAELRKKLIALDYLPESIHRMADHRGGPRARIDLSDTSESGSLALAVSTTPGVTVEPLRLPETDTPAS